jgi:hypothetical protein
MAAVGILRYDGGVILHYDGRAWSPMQSGQGTLLHYDGSSWRPAPTGTTEPLYTVWGAGPTGSCASPADGGRSRTRMSGDTRFPTPSRRSIP